VMSYTRQFSNWIANRPLDYSRSQLATLDESNLNELNGITTSTPPGLATVYGPITTGAHFAFANGNPVNWNVDVGDTDSTDTVVVSDINNFGPAIGNCAAGAFGNPGIQVDNGFDDWNAGFVFQTAGASVEVEQEPLREPELTMTDVRQSRLALLDGIRSAIERLQSTEPSALVGEEEAFDTGHIAELLQSDHLVEAITELNVLKDQVIEAFGLEASQQEVIPLIDNLVLALEKQM
jgi:hypothetical protein